MLTNHPDHKTVSYNNLALRPDTQSLQAKFVKSNKNEKEPRAVPGLQSGILCVSLIIKQHTHFCQKYKVCEF